MINLEWFRTFKTIYETGSLTSAANKLYISQPGVSLHLNSLEAHVGNKLFDRGTRKMLPTEHGKMLYNSVVDEIKKLETIERHFSRNCDANKTGISIGMCFETFQFVLEPYISKLPFNLISKFGDYSDMLNDLDKGLLDFVITPQKDDALNILFTPFSKERIIVIAGSENDVSGFSDILISNVEDCEDWLNKQQWFGTTGDMEHLRNFWMQNFNKRPDFKPNFIVPNMSSIIRCISGREGFAVVPDFLCRKQIENGDIQIVWEGNKPLENTLYFAQRKKTIYTEELKVLQDIFTKELKNGI
ncbi:LysR family transcriptional regulator [Dysgonomonas sp. ZJ709]|uniref:LysR family transcriptional regulator n=1 Tax=Dysgonomonas sp. ZJ709 TaxID=2709797 RepID=UPI0013EBE087|nr:LysR family transcriptional regulator [Dysgonomonas sp. ZJ709]